VKRATLMCALLLAACNGRQSPLIGSDHIDGDSIPNALTDTPGDTDRGKIVFLQREQGHCVLCHVVSELDVAFQGNIGPDLSQVGARLSPAQIRLRIVDYQILSPGTLMPSYYRIHDLYQVQDDYLGETILTAQQVEDLVAYLSQTAEDANEHE